MKSFLWGIQSGKKKPMPLLSGPRSNVRLWCNSFAITLEQHWTHGEPQMGTGKLTIPIKEIRKYWNKEIEGTGWAANQTQREQKCKGSTRSQSLKWIRFCQSKQTVDFWAAEYYTIYGPGLALWNVSVDLDNKHTSDFLGILNGNILVLLYMSKYL